MSSIGSLLTAIETVKVDPLAYKLVPADLGAIGVGFADGYLSVAWPHVPSPGEIAQVSSAVGLPVKPVTLTQQQFEALRAQTSSISVPESMSATSILDMAVGLRASDIHLSAGLPPAFRVNGDLRTVGQVPMSAQEVRSIAEWLVGQETLSPSKFHGDLDSASEYEGWRLRVNVYQQSGQLALAIRVIPASPPEFSSLRLPDVIATFAELPRGLILFAGPTGSGKSTTQAALLNIVNQKSSRHIVTIEDPIEYVHPQRNSVIHQREIGYDTKSFAVALRSVLRQDPDVILVGEMRDPETISTTITAAETGHLVFATVHASSAPEAIDRIVDSFPAEAKSLVRAQLAGCLHAIVCQTLLPSADRPGERQAVTEILIMHDAAKAHIRSGDTHQLRNDYRLNELGSMSLDQALADAVAKGRIERDVAESVCRDKEAFSQFLRVALDDGVRFHDATS